MDFRTVGKKDDRNYVQLRGHVPKAVARRFKQFCLDEEIDYSEGLELVLTAFLSNYSPKPNGDNRQKNQTRLPCENR